MDQNAFWLNKPGVYPQHPPLSYNNDQRTVFELNSAPLTNIISPLSYNIDQRTVLEPNSAPVPNIIPPLSHNNDQRKVLELNSAPVTNIIVQQFEVCNHDRTGITTCQPHCIGGVFNGRDGSNCCFQSSGFSQPFHNSGEAQLEMSGSYFTSRPNFSQIINSAEYNGVSDGYSCGFIKQEPVNAYVSHKQTCNQPLFNPHAEPSIHNNTVTKCLEEYPGSSYFRPFENNWLKAEPPDSYTTSRPIPTSHDIVSEFKNILDRPKRKSREDIHPCGLSNSRPRRESLERRHDIGKSQDARRNRSLDPPCNRIPLRRSSNYVSRKSSRSPKFITRSRCFRSASLKHKNWRCVTQRSRTAARFNSSSRAVITEQQRLIREWRDKSGNNKKTKVDLEAELKKEKQVWIRSAPAEMFYKPAEQFTSNQKIVHGTNKLIALCDEFEESLLNKAESIRASLPKYEPLPRKKKISIKKHSDCHANSSTSSDSSESEGEEDCTKEELDHKKKHPLRLHQELWFNDPGEMNDGPLCRCSAKARRSGIRHNIYAGEKHLGACDANSNNADKLYHYRITISPATNFLVSTPTIIEHDAHEYIFEGFSMFSHKRLDELPLCKVIRFNIEYTIVYYEESFPQNFTVKELNLFHTYLFREILELVDLDLRAAGDPEGCPQYHFMPRFVRQLPDKGKEILSMNEVLGYLLRSAYPLIPKENLTKILSMAQYDWQRFTEDIKGMIVMYPGKKPCSLRVDQLDRDQENSPVEKFPEIVHFGIRPPQLSYAGNPEYQKAWREYVKFRHLLANMPKPSFEDKRKLECKEIKLQNMRTKSELKRNVTVTVSSENFQKTGIMCDVVQHAMLIPVLVSHLRFHRSLDVLEEEIKYKFKNRYLLQLALTHPSYRENFGTNPDHARNSLTNCGIRQPVYGDRKIHYQNTRKRGINTLINIMSRFGKTEETESEITHNERLEFLGDAVVEFVTSVHLFHMFSDLEEGGLATYRAAIVQNQHLAVLAKTLHLEEFMLYAHGSDLCHDLELRHAMANCFEALMGALFLDGGIQVADKVFGEALFYDSEKLLDVWVNYPPHPLQEQEPLGDRKWISKFTWLQNLMKFEESIGVKFTHIRLLARAFTDRSMGYTNLTLGSNQRLEFLGDTVLQLIASEYLYKHFPEHHEGHLSLLRSSLVNNRTQAVVCNDLGMTQYALYSNPKAELKTKDRADLLEAFLGALYVDQDLEFCQVFCNVCFFPRLQDFIMHQDWNDPKSKLQQCCLTLRTMEGGEPEIPVYKVIECMGPTNTRIYTVAVYFKDRRLAKASGHSIQQAEMNAAKKALNNSEGLFPQLDHQKRAISKSMNRQKRGGPYQRSSLSMVQGRSKRNLSPEKTKGNPKTSSDIFSQKIRCRTPPKAYQSRNRSSSLELKSSGKTKKKKCKDKGKRNKGKSDSNDLSDKEPSKNNPCRSRSGSKASTKTASQGPRQKSKPNSTDSSLPQSRNRTVEKQTPCKTFSCGKSKSPSHCQNTKSYPKGGGKDTKINSNPTAMSDPLENENQCALPESMSKAKEVLKIPLHPLNNKNIKKESSCGKVDQQNLPKCNGLGNDISPINSSNHERGNSIVDLSTVMTTISRENPTQKLEGTPSQSNSTLKTQSKAQVQIPESKAKSLPNMVKSLQNRPRKPKSKARSPQGRARNLPSRTESPTPRSKSPTVRTKSTISRTKSPTVKNNSLPPRARSPSTRPGRNTSLRARGSLCRGKSPPLKAGNPPAKARSPLATAKSPRVRTKSSPPTGRTLSARSRSPANISRTLSARVRSPGSRPKSPLTRNKSPPPEARSPANICRTWSTRARSPANISRTLSTRGRSPTSRPRSPLIRTKSSPPRAISPANIGRTSSTRARSPASRAKSPPPKARSPIAKGRSSPLRSRIPACEPRSPASRTKVLSARVSNPPPRVRSPSSRTRSPAFRARSPTYRAGSSSARTKSPVSRPISPISRPRSPVSRHRSPVSRPRSPVSRPRSPVSRPRSPVSRPRSPASRPRSPVSRPRSPVSRPRSPAFRARSPASRAKSPQSKARSLESQVKSTQSFRSRRTPSRSPPPGRRASSRENIQKKMMDYISGKRSSLDIEKKCRSGASSLIDFVFDKKNPSQLPQAAQPVYLPGSNSQCYNTQTPYQMTTNWPPVYYPSVSGNLTINGNGRQTTNNSDCQNDISSYQNSNAPSYPPSDFYR